VPCTGVVVCDLCMVALRDRKYQCSDAPSRGAVEASRRPSYRDSSFGSAMAGQKEVVSCGAKR
jgi:hypothetical protein